MLGFSYGEIFLLLGATAALIGPKDLPIIARTAGRFAGRAIGYVQLVRGQFESVMQLSQAHQAKAQLDAIHHEFFRTVSFVNPGPLTYRHVDNINTTAANGAVENRPKNTDEESIFVEKGPQISKKESTEATALTEDYSSRKALTHMHSQAAAYARLAETTPLKSISVDNEGLSELTDESSSIIVLPVSAESAGLLPQRKDEANGSDIMLEAILEAEGANNGQRVFLAASKPIKK